MPKIPYFPFYPDDWLSSPRITTADYEDRGLYIHLLCQTWNHPGCQLPNDKKYLMRLCPGARWKRIERVLQNFFVLTELAQRFVWRNDRLSYEFMKSLDKHQKAKDSANALWNKRKQEANAMRTQSEGISERYANQNQNQNHKEPKYSVDRSKKRFVPPSLQNVMDYCQERKNKVDPQKWIDHYTSNGWKVGRNAMKDWKAAIRTWEKNGSNGSKVVDINAGGFMPKTAQDELLYALKNQNNTRMPYLSDEAKKLFYSFNLHWDVLQARVIRGVDIFAPIEVDRKTIAAGE